MGDIGFVLWSVAVPGVLAGAGSLALAWWVGQRMQRAQLAAGLVWVLWVSLFYVGFLLSPDLRNSVGWPRLDRPGFLVALLPGLLLATLLPLWWKSVWARTVSWSVAAITLAVCFWFAYRWQAKDELFGEGSQWQWYSLSVVGALLFAWSVQCVARCSHWLAVAVYGVTALVVAPFIIFHLEIAMAQSVGVIAALTIGAGVGAGIGKLPLYAMVPALPIGVTLASLASMARVGASVDDTAWLPSLLLVAAFVPWAVLSLLPLVGRARWISHGIGAVLAFGLLTGAVGVAADTYFGDEDAAGGSEAADENPYANF